MADETEKAANPVKKEEQRDGSDSDDNLPIAVRSMRNSNINTNNLIKKEEQKHEDSDDDEVPLAFSKANKKNKEILSKKSNAKPSKVKKEESEDEDFKENARKISVGNSNTKPSKAKKEDDLEEKKRKKVKKGEDKNRNKGKESKNVNNSSGKNKEKKEKKVYDLPGQKHNPPEERDPLRIFYESLYQQVPNSEMAAFWMMEWGLLPADVAKKVYEKKWQKGQLASPAKPTSVIKKSNSNNTINNNSKGKMVNSKDNSGKSKTVKKRKATSDSEVSDDDDDDFIGNFKKQKV